ncbi:GTP pyrophosphokinase [Pseudoalteromonas rhizosphaerae]|uniref:GTP pyrophosphokinase n=1 Tax=Pseudoalteromonas rhizosphaerae TaxID=2518973 RepID=UPI001230BB3F|nr:GTP pyrophosphokinase [Pseudoalteromonas rhizosphaerae]
MSKNDQWLDSVLPAQRRLTESVVTILQNLLKSKGIDYLSVSGRTKDKQSALEKIERKSYKKPSKQMTDLSGIRVIVFFESDIAKVSELIESSFSVDKENSLNQDERLSVDQIGYRSVHFVCDLGRVRTKLPEFEGLDGLKFELQVRTVLQHAWAELAHDRNYKFSGKLPPSIERNLYLYAGMLEIADKGFSQLSNQIDEYIESVHEKNVIGELDYSIDAISLQEFVSSWAEKNALILEPFSFKHGVDDLLNELEQYGVHTAKELSEIIPSAYVATCKELGYSSNIFGYVRDWMIINDWKHMIDNVKISWVLDEDDSIYRKMIPAGEYDAFAGAFDWDELEHEVGAEQN